jgi:hypothetical protein
MNGTGLQVGGTKNRNTLRPVEGSFRNLAVYMEETVNTNNLFGELSA